MDPQENLKFPNMDKDLKLKLSIVPFHVSEMTWLTSFGQESQKSEYEVFLTSPFSPWSPWSNTRSCWKLSSVPLGTWSTGERGNVCPECPAGLTLPPSKHISISQLLWGSQSIHLPLSLASPLAPRPGSLDHFLSFSPFEHLAFFPNALFLPSLLLLSTVVCLSLACLPLLGHLPRELFLCALYCITQHLSPRHTRTTPSPVLCFSFLPHTELL